MFNIAIVPENNYTYDYTSDTLLNDVSKLVKLIEIEEDQLMPSIISTLNLSPELLGSTDTCFEDEDLNIFQVCHILYNKDYPELNKFGSILVSSDVPVFGKCVIIKTQIQNDNTCVLKSITLQEIANMFKSKMLHKGILIKNDSDNNVISSFTYKTDPMELYKDVDVITNYRWFDLPLCGAHLIVFIELNPIKNILNSKATILSRKKALHGDIVVVLKTENNQYIDLDEKLLNKILSIQSDKDIDPNKKTDIKRETQDKKQLIINFFSLLNNAYKEYTIKNPEEQYLKEIPKYNKCFNDILKEYYEKNPLKSSN